MSIKRHGQQKNDSLKNEIIRELYFQQALSCADLSILTDKSIPLVTRMLNELIEDELVVAQGIGISTGGRRPLMYSLKAGEKVIVAVAVDQLCVQIALYDLQHQERHPVAVHDLKLAGNKDALPALVGYIQAYIKQSGYPTENIIAVGLSMPGFVDVQKGINYTFLDAGKQGLRNHISKKIGLPVYMDNDSCLTALAELRFGQARATTNTMVINVAWGIGLGMVLNGTIFRGHNGFAGEFSHIPISDEGELCSCGKRGCLETDASLLVVVKKVREGISKGRTSSLQQVPDSPSGITAELVMEAASQGDQFAIEVLSEAGYCLGKGIAVLIHILNPEAIILSGRGAKAGEIFAAAIQHALHKYAIPRLAESTGLQISDLGPQAALIGAAALVMEHFGEQSTKWQGLKTGQEGYVLNK